MEADPFLLLYFLKMMTLLIVRGIVFLVLFVFIIMISTSDPTNQCEMAWHIDRSAVNFALF